MATSACSQKPSIWAQSTGTIAMLVIPRSPPRSCYPLHRRGKPRCLGPQYKTRGHGCAEGERGQSSAIMDNHQVSLWALGSVVLQLLLAWSTALACVRDDHDHEHEHEHGLCKSIPWCYSSYTSCHPAPPLPSLPRSLLIVAGHNRSNMIQSKPRPCIYRVTPRSLLNQNTSVAKGASVCAEHSVIRISLSSLIKLS